MTILSGIIIFLFLLLLIPEVVAYGLLGFLVMIPVYILVTFPSQCIVIGLLYLVFRKG
jgi:hypothetical protein